MSQTAKTMIDQCEQLMLDACARQEIVLSGDRRVSESDAAKLLGHSSEHLRRLRAEGKGPAVYKRGMNGNRVSYRLRDLAEWIECERETPDWS